MDLDLRKVRYFAAVAEHRHFGRAAESLFIAQPVLSRQIRALEQELGCVLLTRSTRNVQLTPAGERLRDETRALFASIDATVRRVQETARGEERIVVGFAPGLHVSDAMVAFAAVRPQVEITLLPIRWWEPDAPLRDGRADVAFLRRPFDDAGLDVTPVGREEKVACLPISHPLAARDEIVMADLDGEHIMNAQVRRRLASLEEKFELIAAGRGIALVPSSVASSYSRPDLVYVPVRDLPLVDTCIAVAKDRRERRLRDFVDIAIETLGDRQSKDGSPPSGDRQPAGQPLAAGIPAAFGT
jgi:DNA-binding transcriptional LysR family regulator